jgi:PAS domain-containing protein
MIEKNGEPGGIMKLILDAIPSAIYVLDKRLRIHAFNTAARELYGNQAQKKLMRTCGQMLRCFYEPQAIGGCGKSENCHNCVIRNAVLAAVDGKTVHRARYDMKIINQGGFIENVSYQISAHPLEFDGENKVILVLEDITELVVLRELLPICSVCRKIRTDDEKYWDTLEDYIVKKTNIDFTHSICPTCLKDNYSDLWK